MSADSALLAHIGDLIEGVRSKGAPRFSEFLDERQQVLCLPLAQRSGLPFLFFGGWQDASRRMLGVFPEYWEAQGEDFPLAVLTARIPKGFSLCHRDFLGALMNLGIKREMVGDILVDGQGAWVFLQKRLAPLVLQMDRVGKVGLAFQESESEAVDFEQRFQEQRVSLASLRLDCVVAAVCSLSRERAQEKIAAGLVSVDSLPCQRVERQLNSGCKISVRGEGKFILEHNGETTRKGRLCVNIKRYC